MINQQLKKVLFLIILFTTVLGKSQDVSIEKAIYRDILPDLYLDVDFYILTPKQDTVITIIGNDTSIYIRQWKSRVVNAISCDSCHYIIFIENTMLGTRSFDTNQDRLAKRMAEKYNIKWKLDSIPSAEFPYDVIKSSRFTFVKGSKNAVLPIYKQSGTTYYIGSILLSRIQLDEERKKANLAMVISEGTIYSLYIVYNSKLKKWRISESEVLGFF